ncbi:hypothetical protein Dimus_035314, partial [Dionaea muscipula]
MLEDWFEDHLCGSRMMLDFSWSRAALVCLMGGMLFLQWRGKEGISVDGFFRTIGKGIAICILW